MHEWYTISCLQKKFQFPDFVLLHSFRGWWTGQKLAVNLAIKASHRRPSRSRSSPLVTRKLEVDLGQPGRLRLAVLHSVGAAAEGREWRLDPDARTSNVPDRRDEFGGRGRWHKPWLAFRCTRLQSPTGPSATQSTLDRTGRRDRAALVKRLNLEDQWRVGTTPGLGPRDASRSGTATVPAGRR